MLAEVKGRNGILVIGERALIIRRGARGALIGGHRGEKVIPYKSINAVQLKQPGISVGFIQFRISGGREGTKGARKAIQDENAIAFASNTQEFKEAHDYILGKMSE